MSLSTLSVFIQLLGCEDLTDYHCRIATIDDIAEMYDRLIKNYSNGDTNWSALKEKDIQRVGAEQAITYIGSLSGVIICVSKAALDASVVQNSEGLVDERTAYLFAFRTNDDYQGKGYFSKLYHFMIDDLKSRGYERATLGVEPKEETNKKIYRKYGFTEYIKSGKEIYFDGFTVDVDYYAKPLV